jgi:hypothetical protein
VRTSSPGYLCAFGHDATLVTVTERRFESLNGDRSQRVAVLRQREFIVVNRRVIDYDGAEHVHSGRGFPFKRVEILTRVTPNLLRSGEPECELVAAPGDKIYDGSVTPKSAFWPMVPQPDGSLPPALDFRFEILATDICGEQVTFSMPLLFVELNANECKPGEIRRAYNFAPTDRREADLGGATVCFAPDEWVLTPTDWSRNIVSGRTSHLSAGEGRRMWMDCLERAAARRGSEASWTRERATLVGSGGRS